LNPSTFFQRLFEECSDDWENQFRIGDMVIRIREDLFGFTPVGCIGAIREFAFGEENREAVKGRPIYVEWELTPLGLRSKR